MISEFGLCCDRSRLAPKPIAAKVQDGKVSLTLEPKSVTVISVEQ